MKLFYLTQEESTGYDTYDSCVVAAETPAEAVRIHPATRSFDIFWDEDTEKWLWTIEGAGCSSDWDRWCPEWATHIDQITCVEIASESDHKAGLVIASYNAG